MRRTIVAGRTPWRGPAARFVAEWLDPPFAAGHWVPEMVELAGGHDVLGGPGEPSVATTWEEVRGAGPS